MRNGAGGWLTAALLSLTAALAADLPAPPLGLDAFMPVPAENPLTPARIDLGRVLFFDKRLSRDGSLSCATCHVPELGFTDREPVGLGVDGQKGTRRTPRLINRGYGRLYFWDGRAGSLEEQVVQPIANPVEMDLPVEEAAARLAASAESAAAFEAAFGRAPDPQTLAWALAGYVRTIVSGDSSYDRYVAGDGDALTPAQKRGLEVFRGKGACGICHLGPNLTDEEFHNTGVGWKDGPAEDLGREKVTGDAADRGAFKTPTLRDVALAGPYMHDGSLATLEDVVEFYDQGGEANAALDPEIRKLNLTDAEKADLTAFLGALNGRIREGRRDISP
ncbi:MAG: cytochrome-c peroxidase [Acidobacteria bacterium]|nr:cytochrome-c peroxidase [Acidobacteriota bacterium]